MNIIDWWSDFKAFGGLPLFVFAIGVSFVLDSVLSVRLALSLVLCFAVTFGIRAVYFKRRPDGQQFSSVWGRLDASSFPSMHAMRASVLACLFMLYWENIWVSALLILCAFGVAYARVFQRRHDLRDVSAGLLFGIVISVVVSFV